MIVDLIEVKKVLDSCEWDYHVPVEYLNTELLEHDYDIDEVVYWLNKQSFSLRFLKEFYKENEVEIEGYLNTLNESGANTDSSTYRVYMFVDYFADPLSKEKIAHQGKNFDIPNWLKFNALY